ncbi:MAG: hypothetical protein HYZ14_03390 [Bacteroidetes bacterium]|nr:hypothetical protein [Bacteroidota bacterium]
MNGDSLNSKLWQEILNFDLDQPAGEYSFSTRLACENFWTLDFTKRAIIEYKKFMFLAAGNELMVSPSEIVDIVWHQHLIFTNSYTDFCQVLGKRIQHIPSTHNREEREKFKAAKERTHVLYLAHFGKQPADIWEYRDMHASLNLKKARLKIRTFLLVGIAAMVLVFIPLFYLLRPFYLTIDNPDFLLIFIGLAVVVIIVLELINNSYLRTIFRRFHPESFIFRLTPLELVYLKSTDISKVIHGTVNQLIKEKKVEITHNSIQMVPGAQAQNLREYSVLNALQTEKKLTYPPLLYFLTKKAIFLNYAGSMEALKKHIVKSRFFGNLFYANFAALALVFILGAIRMTTGIQNNKPVVFIGIVLVGFIFVSVLHLSRLIGLFGKKTLIAYYKKEVPEKTETRTWEWDYFLTGKTLFATAFIPMVVRSERQKTSTDNSGSFSACGSGCGSSCGGCGGCGGT